MDNIDTDNLSSSERCSSNQPTNEPSSNPSIPTPNPFVPPGGTNPVDPAPYLPPGARRPIPIYMVPEPTADDDAFGKYLTSVSYQLSHQYDVMVSMGAHMSLNSITTHTQPTIDSMIMQKYAVLADASYYNYGNKDVKAFLKTKNHIPGITDFDVISELTSQDNLVLRNHETGEVVISFRGTANASDWSVNGRIPMGFEIQSQRYKEANDLVKRVKTHFPDTDIRLTGHSQGGGISSYLSYTHDLEGIHFQPAMGLSQMKIMGRGTTKPQTVYRTHGDPVSIGATNPLFRGSKNMRVHEIDTLPHLGNDLLGIHSIENFHPAPSISSEMEPLLDNGINVVRNSRGSSLAGVAKAAGKYAGPVLTGLFTAQEVREDLKQGSGEQKAAKVTNTLLENVSEYAAAEGVLAAAVLLTPIGLGAAATMAAAGLTMAGIIAATYAVQAAGHELGKYHLTEKAIHQVSQTFKKTKELISSHRKPILKTAKTLTHALGPGRIPMKRGMKRYGLPFH